MATPTPDRDLRAHYESYYTEGPRSEDLEVWRRLGALDKADNLVDLAAPWPHASILEIGAGDGAILQRLSEIRFGNSFHALEISSSGIERIRRREIAELVEARTFDGARVPYEDQAFDLAVLSHVLEHVEFPRQLLYEAARVARYVFVEVPLEDTLRLPRDFVWNDLGHINFYSPKSIRRLVQTCHLRVLKQRVTNPSRATYVHRLGSKGRVTYWIKELLLRLHRGLATHLLTYHGSLLATRSMTADAGPPNRRERSFPGTIR